MSPSLWSLKYPVRNVWHDFELPFVGNDSVKWVGQLAFVIDAEGEVFQTDALVFDSPWYHCAACSERLSLHAKFCAECGAPLDWEHLDERDPAALAALDAAVRAKLADLAGAESADQDSAA